MNPGTKASKTKASTFGHLMIAGGIGLLFASSLVLFSFLLEGPTVATRSATDLVLPVGMTWLGLLTCAVFCLLQKQRSAALLFMIGFAFLGLTANPYLASKFIEAVEWPEDQSAAIPQSPYRAVIVLGGGAGLSPNQVEQLNRDGERVFSAAQLWHAGLVSSIICTGTVPDGVGHPGEVSAKLLESVGIPTKSIFIVPGENTSQEMDALKKFLEHPPEDFPTSGEIGLMTSGYHQRRAMRLAAAEGLNFLPLPSGYRGQYFPQFSPRAMIPNAESASAFGSALKETLGGLVGR